MTTYFDFLRIASNWTPKFEWKRAIEECADQINSFHEDYPKYVDNTINEIQILEVVLQPLLVLPSMKDQYIKLIHARVFPDYEDQGQYRQCEVMIGLHRPPDHTLVEKYMKQLEMLYENRDWNSLETLMDWYTDFETIHPFRDGNGRVGAAILSAYSHIISPEEGWWTACQ
jgi:Fic family protein